MDDFFRDRHRALLRVRDNAARDYESFVRIIVDADDMPRHAGGTVFQDGKPRVTVEEVRNVARRVLRKDRLTAVAVGALERPTARKVQRHRIGRGHMHCQHTPKA